MREIIYNSDKIILDNGFYFGCGLFETILIKEKPVFLSEHIKRLNKGIEAFNLGPKIDESTINEFIKKNKINNIVLKISVSDKNLIFNTREFKYTKENYIDGFNIRFSQVLRNSTSRLVFFKTLNYNENIIEYELSNKAGYKEAIFLNEKGFVAEGCTTNIFMIKDNIIYTPKKECGLLPGIIRQWVIENYNVVETEISKEELLSSDEIFLTNSLVGIMKVNILENKSFSCNVTEKIKKSYDDVVNEGVGFNG